MGWMHYKWVLMEISHLVSKPFIGVHMYVYVCAYVYVCMYLCIYRCADVYLCACMYLGKPTQVEREGDEDHHHEGVGDHHHEEGVSNHHILYIHHMQ